MDQKAIAMQMINFNRSAFENTFNAVTLFQEQMEKMSLSFMEQSSWLPEEGRKVLDEWVATYKKSRNEFKQAVDDSFQKVEAYFQGDA